MDESRESGVGKLSWFDWLLVVQIGLIVTIVLAAVFFRYVINHSLPWSDEAARYLFVWLTLLGSSAVLRERAHIRVEYEDLPKTSTGKIQRLKLKQKYGDKLYEELQKFAKR